MGATVFRAKDNLRNSTQGVYMLWNEDEYLPGMQIRDITFEFGNNTVEAGESNFTVGVGAYWCSNVVMENVEVRNTSGFWSVLLGGIPAHRSDCKNAILHHIKISNANGSSIANDDTYDHTAIRINMDDVIFTDSILTCDYVPASAAALEFHENNSIANGLIVQNYTTFGNFGVDEAIESYNQVIDGCYISTLNGIVVWSVSGGNVKNFSAVDNQINLINTHSVPGTDSGISNTGDGIFGNITFIRNKVISTKKPDVGDIQVGILLENVRNLIAQDNDLIDLSNGIYLTNDDKIETLFLDRNKINRFGRTDAISQYRTGISVYSTCLDDGGVSSIRDNEIIGLYSDSSIYGILLNAPNLTYTTVYDNDVRGITGTDITTITPSEYITDEIVKISHKSEDKVPAGTGWSVGCQDGSTWALGNGTLCRRDAGVWKRVSWTYL